MAREVSTRVSVHEKLHAAYLLWQWFALLYSASIEPVVEKCLTGCESPGHPMDVIYTNLTRK